MQDHDSSVTDNNCALWKRTTARIGFTVVTVKEKKELVSLPLDLEILFLLDAGESINNVKNGTKGGVAPRGRERGSSSCCYQAKKSRLKNVYNKTYWPIRSR